jgi:hypothetical protein
MTAAYSSRFVTKASRSAGFFVWGVPMTFEEWMRAVDVVVGEIAFGLSVHDLPDIDFRSLYEAGEMAQTAAEEALANADFPFDDLDYLT